MQLGKRSLLFAFFFGCAAAFVLLTSMRLPALVASHFGGAGAANGFLRHGVYVGFMVGLVVGLPSLMVGLTWSAISSPKARLNLPNKDYWLAPERCAETIAYLRSGVLWVGALLVIFLCYLHWLVVLANEAHPARLAISWFIGGLLVFFAALFIGLKAFLGRFRQSA